jgi:aspartate racemase
MKSVGVIGGLGPETTAEFYLRVIFSCQKLNAHARPLVLISSIPLPFEIERDLIATNTGAERYIPFLVQEAKRLEKAGVDFVVMPCNSLHVFIEEIRSAVGIPVLSIVEEAIRYMKVNQFKNVGIISTSATLANNVYESKLSESGIKFVVPTGLQRAKMDQIIQRLIDGQHLNRDREEILAVIDELKASNVDCIALACTDLQLLLPSSEQVTVFDTMKVLADATVREILT